MPDLSYKGTHQFWHDYPDPIIYRIISFMESVENWIPADNPELENALSELGSALDKIGNIDLQEEAKFIEISACLKMGRSLRLLQGMDIAHPGAAAKILMYAEKTAKDNANASLFLQRNIIFERLRSLNRIFSEDRLATIVKVVENNG